MTFRYFPHQAPDGAWHTVYRVPGTEDLQSVMDALTKRAAQSEADRLNRQLDREARANAAHAVPHNERMPAKGFYTDEDAR